MPDVLKLCDWLHLPPDVAPVELSPMVHDGQLVPSSRLVIDERTLSLDVRVPHVAAHHGLPVDHTWRMRMDGVESLRVALFHDLPVEAKPPGGVELSIGWDELVARLARGRADVHRAQLATSVSKAALHLELNVDAPYAFCELWARGASVSIEDARGAALSTSSFVELGASYWRAWSEKQR